MAIGIQHIKPSDPSRVPDWPRPDPAVLDRINQLNDQLRSKEVDDDIEVVAEKDARLSRRNGDGLRAPRRLPSDDQAQHETPELEEEVAKAFEVATSRIARAQGSGNGGCCCPCHLRGIRRNQAGTYPYGEEGLAVGKARKSALWNPKAYDIWADLTSLTKNEIFVMSATPPTLAIGLYLWAKFLGLA